VEDDINNNDQPWGRKGTFAVLACTVKPRPREKKRERKMLVGRPLCRLCTLCALLSASGSDIHPTTLELPRAAYCDLRKYMVACF